MDGGGLGPHAKIVHTRQAGLDTISVRQRIDRCVGSATARCDVRSIQGPMLALPWIKSVPTTWKHVDRLTTEFEERTKGGAQDEKTQEPKKSKGVAVEEDLNGKPLHRGRMTLWRPPLIVQVRSALDT